MYMYLHSSADLYRQNYYPKCAISHSTIEVDSEVCPVLNLKILPGLINAHSVASRCHLNQSAQHLVGWHTELVLLKEMIMRAILSWANCTLY